MAKYRKYSTKKCWLTPARKKKMNPVVDQSGYMVHPNNYRKSK